MATEITMPQMGFDMTEGTIANWLKVEGDMVQKGEPIAEIETDKTTIQIEAFSSGVLMQILAPVGAKVPVGQAIGYIGAPGEKPPSTAPAPSTSTQKAVPTSAASPQTSAVSPSPASTAPFTNVSPVARRMAEQMGIDLAQVKGTGANGQIMREDVEAFAANLPATAVALTSGEPSSMTPAPASEPVAPSPSPASVERVIATPAAKKLADGQNVDLRLVKGSGPAGRIVLEDVANFALAMQKQPVPSGVAPVAAAPAMVGAQQPTPGGQRKPLTRIRQTIAQRMTLSKTTIPHFYITVSVEMDAALALREQINEALKPENIKVSVNDLVIRATAMALARFPNLNAMFTGDAVEQRESIHIGVAVALPGGLVTVTVRDANTKTLREIAVEMVGLATRAREGKAVAGDMGGQTFTITNLGMYGVEEFLAIINPPDAGILAIGAASLTPVVRDGKVVVRNMMQVTISGDHRVTDGAEGAQFVNEVKRILENPWGLVL